MGNVKIVLMILLCSKYDVDGDYFMSVVCMFEIFNN